MTQPRLVATVDVEELSNLEYVDRHFEPGEHGEVRLFLDRDLATPDERHGITRAAYELEAELVREGMQPWEGEPLVELDWNSRTVHIRFVAFETDTPQGRPSAFVMAAFLLAPVMIRGAGFLVRSRGVASLLAKVPWVGKLPAIVSKTSGATAVFKLVRAARKVPIIGKALVFAEIAGAGAAIWVCLDTNQRIQILKWPGKIARKATKALIGAVGAPIVIGIAAVGIGVVLLSRR